MNVIDFAHGSKGEIIPEPLIHDLRPSHLIRWWHQQTQVEITEKHPMYPVCMAAYHQERMRMMFVKPRSEYEKKLVKEILENKQSVQISPINFLSFEPNFSIYPILTFLGNNQWIIGVINSAGSVIISEESPAEAVRRGQEVISDVIQNDIKGSLKNIENGGGEQ